MTDETDAEIEKKIRIKYSDFFEGKRQLLILDGIDGEGRQYEAWHDEIVKRIDDIRRTENISARKAGERISEPYLKEHYVTFNSFMSAYWKRKRERSQENFLRAISSNDIEAAVTAYKQLSPASKRKVELK